MSTALLEVRDLHKRYGAITALAGVSFEVRDGELFGLLGPNGAGKTTTLSIASCLLDATGGEVILDGRDNFNLFNVKAADYNYFEGITFRNTKIAIWAGTQFIAGAKGLTVKRCRFEDVGMGVFTNFSGSSDFYIADSVFIDRKSTRLNSSHRSLSRMPSSA